MTPREKLLLRLSSAQFAHWELHLYLDTHPNDAEALEYFHHFNKARQQALHEYAVRFGPLTLNGAQTDDTWKWATQPWPWEGDC